MDSLSISLSPRDVAARKLEITLTTSHKSISLLTQELIDTHPLVRIAHAARRLSEVQPSGLGQVCSEIGTLLNGNAEEIRTLTESALSRVPAADRDGLQNIPEERAEASCPSLPGPLMQRAHLGEMLAYWSEADTEQEVLRAIGQVLALFFGIRRTFYLRRDGNLLRGTNLFEDEPAASEIAIRLRANGGLIARATSNNTLLHTCGNESSGLTVVDREVSGALACGGLLCMPLSVNGKPLGTFVVGLPPFRCNWLKSQLGLLRDFAGHAAQALATAERRQAHSAWIQHEAQSDCTLRARRAAHELRTPITVIHNYVSVMQMKLARSQPIEADLETISDELMRSDRIIEEFSQGFQKPAGGSKLALNTMIREVAGLLGDTLIKDRGIDLTLSLDDKIPAELDLDAQALRQLVLNLTGNALEAMHEGDGLRLSTEDRVRFENGDYVAVTVADTCPGLPAEVLVRLFEPVRSAKGEYHQGIGLSIVKHLADRIDARIICRSRQDVGTTFTVFLPRRCSRSQP